MNNNANIGGNGANSLIQNYDCAFRLIAQAQQMDRANLPPSSCIQKYREACSYFRAVVTMETDRAKAELVLSQLDAFERRIADLSRGSSGVTERPSANEKNAATGNNNADCSLPEAPTGITYGTIGGAARPLQQENQHQQQQNKLTQLESEVTSKLEAALTLDEKLKLSNNGSGATNADNSATQQCISAYMAAAESHLALVRILDAPDSASSSAIGSDAATIAARKARVSKLKGTLTAVMDRITHLKRTLAATYTSVESMEELLGDLPEVPKFLGGTNNVSDSGSDASKGSVEQAPPVLPAATAPYQHPSVSIPSPAVPPSNDTSTGSSGFSGKEIGILRKSSVVNGRIYQPWVGGEEDRESFRTADGKPFCDPDGLLQLSASQIKAGAIWLRPREILQIIMQGKSGENSPTAVDAAAAVQARQQEEAQNLHLNSADGATGATTAASINTPSVVPTAAPTVVTAPSPTASIPVPVMLHNHAAAAGRITQDIVSDCSFVCSLCITAAFEERFHRQLITKIIYPQNGSNEPIYNKYGKFIVKLHVNGVPRRVVIDDRLPFDPVNKKLLCSCSKNPTEFWISLVEKAYLKLNGGYDFPGSNSGIDVHCLTGWIPEQMWFSDEQERSDAIRKAALVPAVAGTNTTTPASAPAPAVPLDHRQSSERAWERLVSAFKFGDCLVTISTSDSLTKEEEESTGLVPCHAYAVLAVREVGTLRMLQVKNPWARRPWKGRFSSFDVNTRWTEGLRTALALTSKRAFEAMESNGVFWIEYNDVRKYFKSFFLNWNPQLFAFRTVLHDCWPVTQGPANDAYYVGSNPQYSLIIDNNGGKPGSGSSSNKGSMWILFTRHLTVKEQTVNNSETKSNSTGDGQTDDSDYFAVHVFKSAESNSGGGDDDDRLYAPNPSPTIKGIYNNDPHTLIRFDTGDLPGVYEERYTLLLSQMNKKRDCYYTISLYSSNQPFRFRPCADMPPHQLKIKGAWSEITSGGTSRSPTFFMNPQYRVFVGGGSAVRLHIQALFPKTVSALIYLVRTGGSGAIPSDSNTNTTVTGAAADHSNKNPNTCNTGRVDYVDDKRWVVLSSEAYRPGFVYCAGSVAPGVYTAIFSTWTAGATMVGPFLSTYACSSQSIKITEIPAEGAGMNCHTINGAWAMGVGNDGTAAGCNNHGRYLANPIFKFEVVHNSRSGFTSTSGDSTCITLFARLQCTNGTPFAINISLYPCIPVAGGNGSAAAAATGPKPNASPKRALATSAEGVYSDANCGVTLPSTDVWSVGGGGSDGSNANGSSGVYCLIPSTFAPLECSTFTIKVYYTGHPSSIRFL